MGVNPPSENSKPLERLLYEHVFVGNSGSDHGHFSRALKAGNFANAFAAAHNVPVISLDDALVLTLLAREQSPQRFDAMAQRWIVRLIKEREITLHDVTWATQRLRDEKEGRDGRTGLLKLLQQKPQR
jgi:hypothetical protein